MATCIWPGSRAWLSRSDNPKRKLLYTWELAESPEARLMVHPILANSLIREGIESRVISELDGYDEVVTEPRVGEHSRFDLLLRRGNSLCYVEVKNVTMGLGNGRTAFPDAVSVRATRHLRELVATHRCGHRSVLVFCASRTDALSVEPAHAIDPTYASTLLWAVEQGVEVLAYRLAIVGNADSATIRVVARIPVHVGPREL